MTFSKILFPNLFFKEDNLKDNISYENEKKLCVHSLAFKRKNQ